MGVFVIHGFNNVHLKNIRTCISRYFPVSLSIVIASIKSYASHGTLSNCSIFHTNSTKHHIDGMCLPCTNL